MMYLSIYMTSLESVYGWFKNTLFINYNKLHQPDILISHSTQQTTECIKNIDIKILTNYNRSTQCLLLCYFLSKQKKT